MAILTEDQRREVQAVGDTPLRITDPDTQREYVLVPAEVYDRLKRILYDDAEFAASEAYLLMDDVLAKAGWDDPEMDVYDDLARPGKP